MGVDIHEWRRVNEKKDPNPASRFARVSQGAIGSWKGGKSRGQIIGDFYRQKRAQRLLEGRAIDGK